LLLVLFFFFFSSRRRHTRFSRDWSSDVCSSDLQYLFGPVTDSFASENLVEARRAGECIAFDAGGGLDVAITANDSWESVSAKLRSEERRVGKECRIGWLRWE